MNRRDFLKLGGGILIACRADPVRAWRSAGQMPQLQYPADFNAYLRIAPDGRITCYVGKVEMGQGNMTALSQLVADELDVAFEAVDIVMGDTELCPWDLGTFGSMSIAVFGPVLRRAAAEARDVLRQMAAERLHIPEGKVAASDGRLVDRDRPERSVTYGDLAKGRAVMRHVAAPVLKAPAAFTVAGQCISRRDAAAKVTGRALYAGDIRLPRMLYAAVLRPPAHGGSLDGIDTVRASAYPGASVMRDGDLVAVLHEHPDGAAAARDAIFAAATTSSSTENDESIYDHLVAAAPRGQTLAQSGELEQAGARAAATFETTYLNAYVAHAPIEMHTALASFEHGKVTVWASTQAPFLVRTQVADALTLPPEDVRIITPFVGGGFGGKTMAQQAVEAARLSRAVGRPVQVCWDRREEFFFDTFRPAAVVKLRSSLDDDGRIASWECDVYGAGPGGAVPFYDVASQRVVSYGGWQTPEPGLHPFGVGAWRAPAFCSNAFARERHIDTMAAAAGVDPLAFRLNNLSDLRMARVLREAAERFGWTPAAGPSGRGFGMACSLYANTYVGMFAQVAVDPRSGEVRVVRVACAQDMGFVVNPEGAAAQVEGCITMGLGSALSEEVHFDRGVIAERNFDSYEIPRFSWLPRIDVALVDAPDLPPSAGGEPAIPCVAAAIGNAIYDATGANLTRLPMTPARVREALLKRDITDTEVA